MANPNNETMLAPGVTVKKRNGRRWVMLGVLSAGVAFNYLDRSALSLALPSIVKDIHMSSAMEGVVLSAFFWSYVIFQLPAGYLADRIGPRLAEGFAAVGWGLATVLTSFARGFVSFFGLRFVLGLSESPLYTAGAKAIKEWFPKRERSMASGTFNNFSKVGGTIATPLLAILITAVGWRLSFMLVGAIASIWGIVWLRFYRTPRETKDITDAELELIESDQEGAESEQELPKYAVAKLFKQKTMWCMMFGFFSINFISYFFFTWFPTFMIGTYHLELLTFGIIGVLPGICAMIGGWIGGYVCDHLYSTGHSTSFSRKVVLIVGLLLSCVIGLATLYHNIWFTLAMLCIANAASTGAGSVVWTLPADVAPNSSMIGTISGIQNSASNMAGIVCPILIGFILQISNSYTVPLFISGGVAILGALCYFFMPELKPMKLS
ncbi:major facilitator superfamily MFS_1 [Coriobacterium glomerans PW2]|uniref:Major facilitator superfamily MFS_1 n=1 Tax=Coriobacterium glomerans (strain ATCC 49209 / DSM 20642 / JCM 10262 / PW2) TaxID=700015 RepID=F2NA57_CORGP|nr:MFS transporter [Coriobacterium glomerans]AEB06451.1 major facilitator superfamily MFS_1 [Coriobacterium glomerans PW2]